MSMHFEALHFVSYLVLATIYVYILVYIVYVAVLQHFSYFWPSSGVTYAPSTYLLFFFPALVSVFMWVYFVSVVCLLE